MRDNAAETLHSNCLLPTQTADKDPQTWNTVLQFNWKGTYFMTSKNLLWSIGKHHRSPHSPGFTGPESYISDAHQAAHCSCALKRERKNKNFIKWYDQHRLGVFTWKFYINKLGVSPQTACCFVVTNTISALLLILFMLFLSQFCMHVDPTSVQTQILVSLFYFCLYCHRSWPVYITPQVASCV